MASSCLGSVRQELWGQQETTVHEWLILLIAKIQILMDLLLFASAHTGLPGLGVSHAAEVGFGPVVGFTSSLSRFVV